MAVQKPGRHPQVFRIGGLDGWNLKKLESRHVLECLSILSARVEDDEAGIGFAFYFRCAALFLRGLQGPADQSSDSARLARPGVPEDRKVAAEEFVGVDSDLGVVAKQRAPNRDPLVPVVAMGKGLKLRAGWKGDRIPD